MAVGKNKRTAKKRKGQKKPVDPFSRKDWFTVKAPNLFEKPDIGMTMGTKSQGNYHVRDALVGRVFECSLGDLKVDGEEDAFRKFQLRAEDVQGSNIYTNFYGLTMTTDKLHSLVRKYHTLIEAYGDVMTTDGYKLRLFCIGFTHKQDTQRRKTSYAKTSQIKGIRKKMVEKMKLIAEKGNLSELVNNLMNDIFGRDIEKACSGIYPLQNVLIRKVKMLRVPKLDIGRLMELHGGKKATTKKVARDDDEDDMSDAEETKD